MKFEHVQTATAAVWIFALGAAGVLADVTSTPNWMVLTGCAIVPPLMMMRYWNHPGQSMSQSIQQVLR